MKAFMLSVAIVALFASCRHQSSGDSDAKSARSADQVDVYTSQIYADEHGGLVYKKTKLSMIDDSAFDYEFPDDGDLTQNPEFDTDHEGWEYTAKAGGLHGWKDACFEGNQTRLCDKLKALALAKRDAVSGSDNEQADYEKCEETKEGAIVYYWVSNIYVTNGPLVHTNSGEIKACQ